MKKRRLCSICIFFLILQALGMWITGGQFYKKVPASSIFYSDKESKSVEIQGQIYKKAESSKNQILYLKNNSISYQNKSFKESNIIVYTEMENNLKIGETIHFKGQIYLFEEARNPGNFDQKLYYAKQNICGYAWCEKILEITGEEKIVNEKMYQIKKTWKALILENMSKNTGGVLSAILLSEKAEMDIETKELYQKIGIGHILAISGLHISFMGLGIYKILRKIGVPYIAAGVISVSILTGYVCMIGFSVSMIRAYIMLLFRILADVTGRIYDILTALVFSAVITITYQPLYFLDAGFYMSYGAILGITLVKPQLEKLIRTKNIILQSSIGSLSINITLFPIMLWFYYEIPTYSLIMNLIVIPLMSLVLGFGVSGSIFLLCIEPIGKFLLKVVDIILALYEMLAEYGNKLPITTVVLGQPKIYKMFLYYIVLIFLLVFIKTCKKESIQKKYRKYVFGIYLFFTVLFIQIPNGKLSVTFIDVGQGDSIFLRGPYGITYLIDGGSSDVESVGRYRIEPFLKSQGTGVLDYVFVSHGDSDHYNGILEMIQRQSLGIRIKCLVLPINYIQDEKLIELAKIAKNYDIKVVVIEKLEKITEGTMEIVCIQPGKEDIELEGNAGSMVLSISFEKFDLLCTGDVEAEGEEALISQLGKKSYDVLKIAHHGSKYSTTEKFLNIVKPKISIISAGIQNAYGHPHKETLKRLFQNKSRVYQTSEKGAITIESDGDFIDIFLSSI